MAETFSFNTIVHMITIKLSATNYLLWKSRLIPLLDYQNLLSFVDGSLSQPTASSENSSSTNPKFLEWKAKDQQILSLLLSSLSEEAMAVTLGLTTSRDVWLALERVFSHGSKTRERRLKVELPLMKKGSQTVAEFSGDFKNLCDQLLAIGRPVDETDNSQWFLRGLGTDFSGFSSTQLALSSLPRFHDLVPRVAESYVLFQKSLESNSFAPAAFTATRNFSGRGYQFRNRRSRGPPVYNPAGSSSRHPPRYNHNRRACNPHCQICKSDGHTAALCKKSCDRTDSSARLADAFQSSCSSTTGSSASDWYLDTGAPAHMTPDVTSLDSSEQYDGKDTVIVGDGASLPITQSRHESGGGNWKA
ncbi:PREDICTED: uncharacterized protein LOC105131470 [Populus euphratica]|uniref:Uncharacterized protein LOC105131470 n=1 Tax=Populus euphratica TaxID=75702 RepID=A0AAJ6XVG5_POPEU|nr:PREDICTED: uncharacterized protein LOC105131470 [Populus euphratica]